MSIEPYKKNDKMTSFHNKYFRNVSRSIMHEN